MNFTVNTALEIERNCMTPVPYVDYIPPQFGGGKVQLCKYFVFLLVQDISSSDTFCQEIDHICARENWQNKHREKFSSVYKRYNVISRQM